MRIGNTGQRYGIRASGAGEVSAKEDTPLSTRRIIINGFQLVFASKMLVFTPSEGGDE